MNFMDQAQPPMLEEQVRPSSTGFFWTGTLLSLSGLAAGMALLFWFDPNRFPFYPVCYFHRWTGWNCPGCGGLRGVHALLHGQVLAALRDNPLVMLAIPWVAIAGGRRIFRQVQGRALAWPGIGPGKVAWILAGLLVFTILRNIPCAPFTYLSPP